MRRRVLRRRRRSRDPRSRTRPSVPERLLDRRRRHRVRSRHRRGGRRRPRLGSQRHRQRLRRRALRSRRGRVRGGGVASRLAAPLPTVSTRVRAESAVLTPRLPFLRSRSSAVIWQRSSSTWTGPSCAGGAGTAVSSLTPSSEPEPRPQTSISTTTTTAFSTTSASSPTTRIARRSRTSASGTVVESLAEDHTLGVLTNGVPAVQFGKVEEIGLLDHFDIRVASHEPGVRATKPDGDIYEAAKARADAETYVMVGDDREPDIDGAREYGFETVHVDTSAEDLRAPDFRTLATLL
ncbi:hypothetical protein BRD06_10375 [Halobacteriales archaeon QS_9_67_15]|nr:MAG: hypothetical protein BRD06_10375 [Halobacteriales archaeon QS_9_67_15]